jgi:ribosomal subunit interface protein
MQVTPQVTFRNMEHSDALAKAVEEKMGKLERFYDQIVACHVVVDEPHRRHHKGKLYSVHLTVTLPQGEVVVSHDPQDNHAHEDPYVALRDAFNAAYRQLEDYQRRQRGDVKIHPQPATGEVVSLMPTKGHGYIRTPDGGELYFHRNAVLDGGFDALELGSEVRFEAEQDEHGPQATSIHPVGKHHIVPK